MVFYPPPWAPPLPRVPDDVPLCDYVFDDRYRDCPLAESASPFTCGLSGKTYSAVEYGQRTELLARALAKEFGWQPNQGSEWDKVICVYSLNAIDVLSLCWAIQRCGGIASTANAAYTVSDLCHQLEDGKAKAIFACSATLQVALQAAERVGIPRSRVYVLDLPPQLPALEAAKEFKALEQFVEEGKKLPPSEKLSWAPGEAKRKVAFLCYSSGTSGLPKGVMISHYNVIANITQICTDQTKGREATLRKAGIKHDTVLGLLPQSHIYSLVVICHAHAYRGDKVVVLPKFDFGNLLDSIQNHKIGTLYLVPPIILAMLNNKKACETRDLSSVHSVYSGAAPLSAEVGQLFSDWMGWKVFQGYGLTETATVVISTRSDDVWMGSSGCLTTGCEARLLDADDKEIFAYDTPGELVIRSPSVTVGYLNNTKATEETFQDGWMRTGDVAVVRKSPAGYEHYFIVDRLKELIKVKGLQVAPAELEAHLLVHEYVDDATVIPIPDDRAGELPKAIVVKSSAAASLPEDQVVAAITKHVEDHKARHKWLKGGVGFIDKIPKSPSGKILRRLLRDQERAKIRAKDGAKL